MAKADFISQRKKNQEGTLTDDVVDALYEAERPKRFSVAKTPVETEKAVTEAAASPEKVIITETVNDSASTEPVKEERRGRKSNAEKGLDKKIVTYSISTAHIRQIKLISVDTGQPLSEIVDDAIEEYVRKHYPRFQA